MARFKLYFDSLIFHVNAKDRTDAFIGHDPFADGRRLLLFTAFLLAVAALQFARRIELVFIPQAAHEAAADPRNLGRIEGHALALGHADRHGLEIPEEGRAAQRPAAVADTADHLGFIAKANLAKFNTSTKDRSQIADQFAEVDTAVSRKEEDDFSHIEGIIDIDELHRQLVLGDFRQADTEGFLLPFLIPLNLAQILGRSLADNRLQRLDDFRIIDVARRNDDVTKLHPSRRFYDDSVIQGELNIIGIKIVYLSSRFKTHTYNDHLKSSFEPYRPETDIVPN